VKGDLPGLDDHGGTLELDVFIEPLPEEGVIAGPSHALLLQMFARGRHEVAVDGGHLLPRTDGREIAVATELGGGDDTCEGAVRSRHRLIVNKIIIWDDHFHCWYMPISDVIVPQAPTVFPEKDPGFRKEYATGMSKITLTVSMARGTSCFLLSFSG
jgi:hypothetical protein